MIDGFRAGADASVITLVTTCVDASTQAPHKKLEFGISSTPSSELEFAMASVLF